VHQLVNINIYIKMHVAMIKFKTLFDVVVQSI